ncbi:MAG: hypothetical protein ACK56I_00365 [bacterium]
MFLERDQRQRLGKTAKPASFLHPGATIGWIHPPPRRRGNGRRGRPARKTRAVERPPHGIRTGGSPRVSMATSHRPRSIGEAGLTQSRKLCDEAVCRA